MKLPRTGAKAPGGVGALKDAPVFGEAGAERIGASRTAKSQEEYIIYSS